MSIFKALIFEPDLEWEFIDRGIVKAHQHSTGAASKDNEAIGKFKGGNISKMTFLFIKIAPELIEQLSLLEHTIADKGHDSEEV